MVQPQASSTRLKIEFAQASDPGRDPNKQINEDSCGYCETRLGYLLVLCDGMGGHYGGREASQLAIKTIFEMFEQAPSHVAPTAVLKASIEEAGRRVYTLGGPPENRTRPGSTCVSLLLHDRGLDVAHVGDSRAYVIRANQIYPLTRDHSMVQGMLDAGLLTEEQAIGHPDGNKITRALGMRPEVEVEVRPDPMEVFPGDLFILASDGLTDLVRTHEILGVMRQALASGTVVNACSSLVQMANERGGHDNITVQIARVLDVPPKVSLTIPAAPSPIAAGAQDGAIAAGAAPQPVAPTRPGSLQETIAMTRADGVGQGAYAAPPMPPQSAIAGPGAADPPAVQPPGMGLPPAQLGVNPQQPQFGIGQPPQAMGQQPPQAALPGQPGGWSPAAPAPAGPLPLQPPLQSPLQPPSPTLTNTPGPGPTLTGVPSQPPLPSPPVPPQGPGPTMTEAQAAGDQAWSSQTHSPVPQPPAGLAQYRMDAGPASLPLPPPRVGAGGYPHTPSQTRPPQTLHEHTAPLQQYGAPGPTPIGHSFSHPDARPSKGGIVFVIIGISAVIAVILVVVLWAVLNR